jgi:RimJ/RimL family protein N-acetyltransferase
MAHPYWPLFDLVVRTPRLELRYPADELLVGMIDAIRGGIHDPATMPFSEPWTDAPFSELQHTSLQHLWRARAEHTADSWRLHLLVLCDGQVVGMQDAIAKDFARLRQAETGSWLGLAHQGRGIGKEMRAAMLHLLFDGLGVSRALGYLPNGEEVRLRRDRPDRLVHLLLPREVWEQHRRDDIEIEGLDACRHLLIANPGGLGGQDPA